MPNRPGIRNPGHEDILSMITPLGNVTRNAPRNHTGRPRHKCGPIYHTLQSDLDSIRARIRALSHTAPQTPLHTC